MTTTQGLELRSLISAEGVLTLSLVSAPYPETGPDEVVVEVQATPINPSDLGLLTGSADVATATAQGSGAQAVLTARIPPERMPVMAARVGQSLPVGNEGAGKVVSAGASPQAQALLGKTVAILGGAMYARFRKIRAEDCLILPADATAADGASCFVNPLTTLGMIGTMKADGHTAIVHTAAASNLGQMLNRLCIADGIGLVNVVRSPAQAEILTKDGAQHVVDTSAASFKNDLRVALAATGATLVFDAIGGGRLVSDILASMEIVANASGAAYNRYGSTTFKQAYIYGALDLRPTELIRSFGFSWSVGGWLLTPFLLKAGPEETERLRQRVVTELKTTFASRYARTIPLTAVLDPDTLREFSRRATGEKYLIDPSLGG